MSHAADDATRRAATATAARRAVLSGDGGGAAEIEGAVTTEAGPACLWCQTPYRARNSGGREQRFCSERCRRLFHAAVRRWALGELAAGRLTLADIKNGLPATRAFATNAVRPSPVPAAEGEAAAALLDELNDLLVTILDALTVEELNKLPDPVSALLDRMVLAGS